MTSGRSTFTGSYVLEIDGADAGVMATATGGEAFGEVVEEPPVGAFVGKHLIGVGYSPIVLEAPVGGGGPLAKWVAAMLTDTQTPKSGAVITLDVGQREHSRLAFRSALITEVEFPGADMSSKEAARMRVTIRPSATELLPGSGTRTLSTPSGKRRKMAFASNFRFSVNGLEDAGRRVIDVSSMLVRRVTVDEDGRGTVGRRGTGGAHVLQVSQIAFAVPAADAGPYGEWFEDFVIKGNSGAGRQRSATLSFLDATLRDELARLDLSGVGIVRLSRSAGTSDVVTTVQMYCERAVFS